jgi:two-component system, chemotaxis family, chemotaxis protein CheY
MVRVHDELAQDYLAECLEHLINVEADLLAIEESGAEVDRELVNRAFRAVHWINGDAGLFDLIKIRVLANQTEVVLALVLSRNLHPTPDQIRILLRAVDCLRDLIRNPDESNQADVTEIMTALMGLCANRATNEAGGQHPHPLGLKPLRMLLVEDDFDSRLLLQTFLCNYGECHVAVNGKEAITAFCSALEHGKRYDLICMDVMMPEMDGREAVRRVRALEEEHGILSSSGAKIIMTTAVDDVKEVIRCFRELCDSYLTKPVDLALLLGQMKAYHLIQ